LLVTFVLDIEKHILYIVFSRCCWHTNRTFTIISVNNELIISFVSSSSWLQLLFSLFTIMYYHKIRPIQTIWVMHNKQLHPAKQTKRPFIMSRLPVTRSCLQGGRRTWKPRLIFTLFYFLRKMYVSSTNIPTLVRKRMTDR